MGEILVYCTPGSKWPERAGAYKYNPVVGTYKYKYYDCLSFKLSGSRLRSRWTGLYQQVRVPVRCQPITERCSRGTHCRYSFTTMTVKYGSLRHVLYLPTHERTTAYQVLPVPWYCLYSTSYLAVLYSYGLRLWSRACCMRRLLLLLDRG